MKFARPAQGLACIASTLLLLAGCTAQFKQFQASQLAAEGKHEASVEKLEEAVKAAPRNIEIRKDWINQRQQLLDRNLAAGRAKLQAGAFDEAETTYRNLLKMDANLSGPTQGLEEVERARRLSSYDQDARKLAEQGKLEQAVSAITHVTAEKPSNKEAQRFKEKLQSSEKSQLGIGNLNGLYPKPISLVFRDIQIHQAFEALARTTDINFILDKDIRPDLRATLFLRQASLEDAVNLLLSTNRLEKKILNERSVLVYPADPAKAKEYQDLMVRAFYLDHADAKQVANTLKTLLKVREAIPDEKLNMILMRDTPEALVLAERIIKLHEIPEAEVMLEVEVLEVTRNKLMNLGIQWPAQASLTPLSLAGATATTLADLKRLADPRIQAAVGATTLNANKTDSDVNLLANPRIRVRNKSKAKILIGDKVPIITTTSTATGFVSETVQYVDVGLKLDVEPRVYADDDVSIKISLEVSSLVKEVRSSGGTLAYQIGTRNADTLLKLRNGETQILAGLLNDEERSSGNRVPFVGDIPLLGRLFGTQKDERNKTEIILSITPRIVQAAGRPTLDSAQFWSGSETTLRTRPLALPSASQPTANNAPTHETQPTDTARVQPIQVGQAVAPATEVELSWKPPATAKVGEVVAVPLKIKTNGAVRSLPFQIGFDPSSLEIVKIEDGGFFATDTGEASLSSNVDVSSGKLFASLTRSTIDGASGTGTAAIIFVRSRRAEKPIELTLLGATPISSNNQVISPALPGTASIPVSP